MSARYLRSEEWQQIVSHCLPLADFQSRFFPASMLNGRLGDSPLTGAARMAVLMASAQKHSSGGKPGHGSGSGAQDSAQRADWGAAAKSNLFDKLDCRGWREGQRDGFTYRFSPRIWSLPLKLRTLSLPPRIKRQSDGGG